MTICQDDLVAIEETLGKYYKIYHKKIYRYFRRKGLGHELAEDYSQETFYRILRNGNIFTDECQARNFIFKVAQNLSIDHLRKKSTTSQVLPAGEDDNPLECWAVDSCLDPEMGYLSVETSRDIAVALKSLPERYVKVIVMREYEGLSYREIAERMGISEKAVESLLHRARMELKEKLDYLGKKRGGWWSAILLPAKGFMARLKSGLSQVWQKMLFHFHELSGVGEKVSAVFAPTIGMLILGALTGFFILGGLLGGGTGSPLRASQDSPVVESPAKVTSAHAAESYVFSGEVGELKAHPEESDILKLLSILKNAPGSILILVDGLAANFLNYLVAEVEQLSMTLNTTVEEIRGSSLQIATEGLAEVTRRGDSSPGRQLPLVSDVSGSIGVGRLVENAFTLVNQSVDNTLDLVNGVVETVGKALKPPSQ
jgi:RNA polymerase sigma-70 factor (ECF subfamily)